MRKFGVLLAMTTGFFLVPIFARAGVLVSTLTPGREGSYTSAGRETVLDIGAGNHGRLGVGDVVYGLFDFRTFPRTRDAHGNWQSEPANSVYGVFSEQVTSVRRITRFDQSHRKYYEYNITFGPTTAAGYSLTALTGRQVDSRAMFAFFDRPNAFPVGSGSSRGDVFVFGPPGGGGTQQSIQFIAAHGAFELSAGLKNAKDFLVAQSALMKPGQDCFADLSLLPRMGQTQYLGTVAGGLSILDNHTGKGFNLDPPILNILTGKWSKNQMETQAVLFGDLGADNADAFGPGFTSAAEFNFDPVAAAPEPRSLALATLGAGVLAAGALRRRHGKGLRLAKKQA